MPDTMFEMPPDGGDARSRPRGGAAATPGTVFEMPDAGPPPGAASAHYDPVNPPRHGWRRWVALLIVVGLLVALGAFYVA